MSSPVTPQTVSTPVAPQSRSRIPIRIAALTPVWLYLVSQLMSSNALSGPMVSEPPSIVGIPVVIVVGALAVGWMLIGLGLVWNVRSVLTDMLALLLFTIPATLVVVLGPAMILILQNLG